MRRARFLGLGDLERLANDLWDDRRVGQSRVPLRDRGEYLRNVDVLMRLFVHALEVALTGERDERGPVEEGVRDRRREVHRPWPERAQAYPGAAREAAVYVRDIAATLLVTHRDELDRGVGERLVEIEGLLTRDAEDVLDAFGLEAFDEDVRCLPRSQCRLTVQRERGAIPQPLCRTPDPYRLFALLPTTVLEP